MKLESQLQLPPSDRTEEPQPQTALEPLPATAGEMESAVEPQPDGRNVINISGDTVTLNTSWMPEEQRDLVRWLYGWIKDQEMSWREVARETDIDSSTLSRIFNDRYRYPDSTKRADGASVPHPRAGERVSLGSITERIKRFKKLCLERQSLGTMGFVETSVWKRVDRICQEALTMQCFGFIYGNPQVGKTESLKEHQRRNNHGQTIYTLTPAAAGKQELIKALAETCRISARTSFDQLRARVTKSLDPTKLVILDEVHELFRSYQQAAMFKCLSTIRQMQEKAQCGFVLCGTNDFRSEIEEGEFAQYLRQFRLRGILELQLEDHPSQKDMQLIAASYNLPEPAGDAAEHVKWVGREWGLGRYCKFLRRANQMANQRGEALCWEHFVKILGVAAELRTKPGKKL